jgi:N-methylhydantoinase A/oxoprolinase/acetone carboxylase beta subunit
MPNNTAGLELLLLQRGLQADTCDFICFTADGQQLEVCVRLACGIPRVVVAAVVVVLAGWQVGAAVMLIILQQSQRPAQGLLLTT